MKLFSGIIYLCLALPLYLNAMEFWEFKREIHGSSQAYCPMYADRTPYTNTFQPAPKKKSSASTTREQPTKKRCS